MKRAMLLLIVLIPVVASNAEKITILHTNDIHSHLLGGEPTLDYSPETVNDDQTLGGMARMKTVIDGVRGDRENPVLLFDAGDFTMGSAFHLQCREEAFELELMHRFGYDAVALGNHEYDLRPDGLAQMLKTAEAKGRLPRILAANLAFDPGNPDDDSLAECFARDLAVPHTVIEAGSLRLGVIGIMGPGAINDSPYAAPAIFTDPLEAARRSAVYLKEEEGVDGVICLSHGGLSESKDKDFDRHLAAEVPEIDVIISGHSHTRTLTPEMVGTTPIVQSGSYGKYLGILDLDYDGETGFQVLGYESRPIDDSIGGHPETTDLISFFRGEVSRRVLGPGDFSWDSPVATTDFDLPLVAGESPVGNLLTDGIAWSLRQAGIVGPDEPVIVIESNGLIRAQLKRGRTGVITAGDLFSVFPLGFGTVRELGYPMLLFYMTGEDLKKAMEVVTTVAPLMGNDYVLQFSGLKMTYNPHRMLFDRVTSLETTTSRGHVPVDMKDPDGLYKVSVNTYIGAMLAVVGDHTAGILDIVPRDSEGNPIADLQTHLVDLDSNRSGVQELKEWKALQTYVQSLPDLNGDGLGEIPREYEHPQGRGLSSPSLNPLALMGGTWITGLAWGIGVLALVIAVLVVYGLVKAGQKIAGRRKTGARI